jgi:hypothetical protein
MIHANAGNGSGIIRTGDFVNLGQHARKPA